MGRNEKGWSIPLEVVNGGGGAAAPVDMLVKQRYDRMAVQGSSSLCCSPEESYSPEELASVPLIVRELSSSCGSPLKGQEVKPDQCILDLGSGAGLDALLCAKRYPASKVIGVDASPNMVKTARSAAAEMNLSNVEFRVGDIRRVPLRDQSVDIAISNCVISMFEDKSKVLSEAFRVLRPGGLLMISDTLLENAEAQAFSHAPHDWEKCIVALSPQEYEGLILSSGFDRVEFRDKKKVLYRDGQEVVSVKVVAMKSDRLDAQSCCC